MKLSKTARASGATGNVKSRGPKRNRQKHKLGHRSRKAAACPVCHRRQRRSERRHVSGKKRKGQWSPDAKPCQFASSHP